jgi:hypothetical protein
MTRGYYVLDMVYAIFLFSTKSIVEESNELENGQA